MRRRVYHYLLNTLTADAWAPSNEGGAQDFQSYMSAILRDGYGDHHVLVALCRLYHFDYSIVRSDGYIAQSFLLSEDLERFVRRIYAGFLTNMQHYVPLFPMVICVFYLQC
jgi:hypothetical protein